MVMSCDCLNGLNCLHFLRLNWCMRNISIPGLAFIKISQNSPHSSNPPHPSKGLHKYNRMEIFKAFVRIPAAPPLIFGKKKHYGNFFKLLKSTCTIGQWEETLPAPPQSLMRHPVVFFCFISYFLNNLIFFFSYKISLKLWMIISVMYAIYRIAEANPEKTLMF